jgi:hypothetical protein
LRFLPPSRAGRTGQGGAGLGGLARSTRR